MSISTKVLTVVGAASLAVTAIVGIGVLPASADTSSQTVTIDPAQSSVGGTVVLQDGVVYKVEIDGVVTVDPSNKDEQAWNGLDKVTRNGVPISPKPVPETVTLGGKPLVKYHVGPKPGKSSDDSVSYEVVYGTSDEGSSTLTVATGLNIVGRDGGGNYRVTFTAVSTG